MEEIIAAYKMVSEGMDASEIQQPRDAFGKLIPALCNPSEELAEAWVAKEEAFAAWTRDMPSVRLAEELNAASVRFSELLAKEFPQTKEFLEVSLATESDDEEMDSRADAGPASASGQTDQEAPPSTQSDDEMEAELATESDDEFNRSLADAGAAEAASASGLADQRTARQGGKRKRTATTLDQLDELSPGSQAIAAEGVKGSSNRKGRAGAAPGSKKVRVPTDVQPLQFPPQGATYTEEWIADATPVITSLTAVEYVEYPYRGRLMKRAPKREFYYPGHEDKIYRWGQERTAYPGGSKFSGLEMPDWMKAIADRIRSEFGEEVNHAIAIKYAHGTEHHAPPHQDKIAKDTSFFVLSFGTPRTFQLLSKVKPTEVVEWEALLASGSLLVISGPLNKSHFHALPKDKDWAGDPRYSLIFRTIRTS